MGNYRHEIVSGLAKLIDNYGGKVKGHPIFGALWLGFKGQIPGMLLSLDENDEACEQIRKEVMEALGLYEVGEAEITVVPAPPVIEPTAASGTYEENGKGEVIVTTTEGEAEGEAEAEEYR